ncbi:MAG: FAD-dependent oxidoreductase [Desulfobacterales bacterium]|jgi:sarcosine oxidase subunit beta
MSRKYDAVIIGAGIIGCCVAFELAKKGYATLNVDKLPESGHGSTANSCAVIRLHYSTPDGVALARESYFYWLNWENYLETNDSRGMIKYINTGCLVTRTERNKYLKYVTKSLDELNVEYEELDAAGIKRKFPFIDTRKYGPPKLLGDQDFGKVTGDAIEGAVYIPESGYISDPILSTHNVQVAAEAKGAEFQFNTEVVDILKESDRVAGIRLKGGTEIESPIVVNVAGPHSFIINRLAGVEENMTIKTRALRQEVAHVPSPEGVDYQAAAPLISDGDIGCYSRPEVGNNVLIGSEDPDCDVLEWIDDLDNFNRNLTLQAHTQVMREAQRISGLPVPNQLQGIVDLYDCSDDWIPIYDKSDLSGFYMAVGTSGNQYKNAPVVGALMAYLIGKVEAGHDHDKDPVLYPLKYVKRSLNIGFFSRLREINKDSSFSVIG